MSEKSVIVKDHLLGETRTYTVNHYFAVLIGMVGEIKAKRIMMEASMYKQRSFECPKTKCIYTISFPV